MDNYLNLALQAVTSASIICKQIQSQLVSEDSLTKKDKSPVTIADYASQALICQMLNKQFPDIPVVGEEDSGSLRQSENKILLDKIKTFLTDWSDEQIASKSMKRGFSPLNVVFYLHGYVLVWRLFL